MAAMEMVVGMAWQWHCVPSASGFSLGTERKLPSLTQLTCIHRTAICGGHSEMIRTQHAADHDGPTLQPGRLGNSHIGDDNHGELGLWCCAKKFQRMSQRCLSQRRGCIERTRT